MATNNNEKQDVNGFFDTIEMSEILEFIDSENTKVINEDKIDQIAEAWSQVDRKKLYKN